MDASSATVRERKFSTSNLPNGPREASKFLPGYMLGEQLPAPMGQAAGALHVPLQPNPVLNANANLADQAPPQHDNSQQAGQSANENANLENLDPLAAVAGPSGFVTQVKIMKICLKKISPFFLKML